MLGLKCKRKTAKELAPHQFTNLFLKFIFEKNNNKYTDAIIVVGAIYTQ
jgi:hypothetical protein